MSKTKNTYRATHNISCCDPWYETGTVAVHGNAVATSRSMRRAIQRAKKLAHGEFECARNAVIASGRCPADCLVLDDTSVERNGQYARSVDYDGTVRNRGRKVLR